MDAALGALGPAVERRAKLLADADVLARVWRRDHTVWRDDPTEIADRLGWLTVIEEMRGRLADLTSFASGAAGAGLKTAVLLGMGGSSLAPEVLITTLGRAAGALDLVVLDTTHPGTIARVAGGLDLATTLFVVASKSGTTVETLSHFAYFWEQAPRGEQFAAVTDPGSPLESLAREHGFRAVFANPADIGGRYSALSCFGLVPAALIGADLGALLDAAGDAARECEPKAAPADNPGARLGAILGEAALAGRDKLTLVLPDEVASLGDWIEQLIAESTGKEGKGIVPVVGEPLGAPEAYGSDRLFVALGAHPGLAPLEAAGHPVVRLGDAARDRLGAQFFLWEFATAIAGHVLGINPFDQPNVAEAKAATKEILEGEAVPEMRFDDPAVLLAQVAPGDYVSIQAYLDRTPATEAALQRARVAIRDRFGVATTVGFGPRFLHSTGQLHKGGPPTGVFIQVVDEARATDLKIPGAAYTFGTLIDAQALGDLRSLQARGRRVGRTTLPALAEAG
jgi:glucose-6-phosphate isomerase